MNNDHPLKKNGQGFGMTITMDLCNTGVGRRQEARRDP